MILLKSGLSRFMYPRLFLNGLSLGIVRVLMYALLLLFVSMLLVFVYLVFMYGYSNNFLLCFSLVHLLVGLSLCFCKNCVFDSHSFNSFKDIMKGLYYYANQTSDVNALNKEVDNHLDSKKLVLPMEEVNFFKCKEINKIFARTVLLALLRDPKPVNKELYLTAGKMYFSDIDEFEKKAELGKQDQESFLWDKINLEYRNRLIDNQTVFVIANVMLCLDVIKGMFNNKTNFQKYIQKKITISKKPITIQDSSFLLMDMKEWIEKKDSQGKELKERYGNSINKAIIFFERHHIAGAEYIKNIFHAESNENL